jgi:cytochrome c-type biogenesis protein CcmH
VSRWVPAFLGGVVAAVVVLAAVQLLGDSGAPTRAEVADSLARELRCPDCQGLSVADSPTASAREIRRQIDDLLAGGATPDEVRGHFVARYGEWILLAPSAPIVWILPFAAVLAGVAILGLLLHRRPASACARGDAATLSEAERRALRDEAEALNA